MMTEFKGDELSVKVLEGMRKRLLLEYRFLEPGLYRLNFKSWANDRTATDGVHYFYGVKRTLGDFANGREKDIELDYLHTVIHCVFLHPFTAYHSSVNDKIRDLAADICVANIMCDFGISLDSEIIIWIEHFKDRLKVLSVGSLSKYLLSVDEDERNLLERLFMRDSHELWKKRQSQEDNREGDKKNTQKKDTGEVGDNTGEKDTGEVGDNTGENDTGEAGDNTPDSGTKDLENNSLDSNYVNCSIQNLAEEWKQASEKIKMDIESFSSMKYAGEMSQSLIQNIEAAVKEKVDYREFLMKFTKHEETMKLDLDEFDYVYYCYGMKLVDNKRIALVEPLEYKNEQIIKDFVIAIDTSGSCSGEIVKNFLIKTYNILKDIEKLNEGFHKINLHIIQCDCRIQEDMKICNVEDFEQYMENFQVKGMGGTDFRPVFDYIDDLIKQKSLSVDLGGLIYFTDGYGKYPSSPPAYKTAMVFLDDDEKANDFKGVPGWAIKIIISEI